MTYSTLLASTNAFKCVFAFYFYKWNHVKFQLWQDFSCFACASSSFECLFFANKIHTVWLSHMLWRTRDFTLLAFAEKLVGHTLWKWLCFSLHREKATWSKQSACRQFCYLSTVARSSRVLCWKSLDGRWCTSSYCVVGEANSMMDGLF